MRIVNVKGPSSPLLYAAHRMVYVPGRKAAKIEIVRSSDGSPDHATTLLMVSSLIKIDRFGKCFGVSTKYLLKSNIEKNARIDRVGHVR